MLSYLPTSFAGLDSARAARARRSPIAVLFALLCVLVLGDAVWPATASAQMPSPKPGGGLIDRHVPPVIVALFAQNAFGDGWIVQGQVQGCTPLSSITLTFGGVAQGQQTGTGSDGSFCIVVMMPPDSQGIVTAVATCKDGLTSEMVSCTLDNSAVGT